MKLNKGDIVKFTEKSKNHGMLAKVVDVMPGKVKVSSSHALHLASGEMSHVATVPLGSGLITLSKRAPAPDNVVSIFEARKQRAKETGNTASYNFNEIMFKNHAKEERIRKEREQANKSVTRDYRLK